MSLLSTQRKLETSAHSLHKIVMSSNRWEDMYMYMPSESSVFQSHQLLKLIFGKPPDLTQNTVSQQKFLLYCRQLT